MRREGIVGAAALSALVLFAPACPLEAGPAVVPAPRSTRYTIRKAREPAREIARQDGLVAWAPDARELELARGLLREARERRQGDGSGGDVANAVAIQVAYSDPEVGNVVLLIWEENRSNKPNVKIFVNGQLFATAPGLPDAELDDNGDGKVDDQDTQGDDANAIFIGPFPAGAYSFRVEGGGTEALADLVVVAEQP
ncbi:MAG: hypothetical protein HY721_19360, partial [Planctomycetes bacterium]|nr:hypothetical protein [Planctomycetota bacterium]